jgi:hypothetical protein
MSTESSSQDAVLRDILEGLKAMRLENSHLAAAVDKINGRVNMLAGIKQLKDDAATEAVNGTLTQDKAAEAGSAQSVEAVSQQYEQPATSVDAPRRTSVSKTSKIILTSYPGQSGVDPLPMQWGAKDPAVRGPVVVSRHNNTIRRRNGLFTVSHSMLHVLIFPSHRCPRRVVFHLQRPRRGKQEPRHYPQARLHKHRACCEYWAFPSVERWEEDCRYGPIRSSCALVIQRHHGQGRR